MHSTCRAVLLIFLARPLFKSTLSVALLLLKYLPLENIRVNQSKVFLKVNWKCRIPNVYTNTPLSCIGILYWDKKSASLLLAHNDQQRFKTYPTSQYSLSVLE